MSSLPSQLALHIKNHWRSQIDSDYFPETHYLFLKRFHPALLQPQTHLSKTLVTVVPRTSRLTHTKTSNRYLKHCFLKYATRSYNNQFANVLHKPSMFFSCVTTHLLITYVNKRSKTNTQTQSFQVRRLKLIRRSKPQRLSFSPWPTHSYTQIFFKTTASEVTVPNTFLFLSACFIPSFTLVYTTSHRFHITPQHPPHRFRQHLTPTAQPFNAVIIGTILHNPIAISIPQYWRECSDHFSDRSEDPKTSYRSNTLSLRSMNLLYKLPQTASWPWSSTNTIQKLHEDHKPRCYVHPFFIFAHIFSTDVLKRNLKTNEDVEDGFSKGSQTGSSHTHLPPHQLPLPPSTKDTHHIPPKLLNSSNQPIRLPQLRQIVTAPT